MASNRPPSSSSGTATSIREAVGLLAGILNVTKPINFDADAFPAREGDNSHAADLANIRNCLGWSPKISLDEGLRKLVHSLEVL